jgi:putative DNA primase/helicase
VPQVLKAATAEYRKDMDIVQSFIDDCCVLAANAETMASQLYREFARYAREAGVVVPSQTEFGRSLATRGIVSRKSSVVYRVGIGLRPAIQDGRLVA